MTEFNPGDRVRVTYEAIWDQNRGTHFWLRDATDGTTVSVPRTAGVELIERADDPDAAEQSSVCDKCGSRIVDGPSKDPIGTVRASNIFTGGQWAKQQAGMRSLWVYIAGHYAQSAKVIYDSDVAGWPIVGAVPNTPAWDAWQKGELKGAPEFPGGQDKPAGYPWPVGTRIEARDSRDSGKVRTGALVDPDEHRQANEVQYRRDDGGEYYAYTEQVRALP